VTKHLPKELYQQEKKLITAFKEAQRSNKSTSWTIKNGENCFIIDGTQAKV